MDKFHIDMPDDLEIENQINLIVDNSMPTKKTLYTYLKNMYNDVGLANLFNNKLELAFIGALTIVILLFGANIFKNINPYVKENIYVFIFSTSPLFYLGANLYTFISISENKTYETEMVCKYNIYEISAFRMLVFSILCIVINTLALLFMYKNINLFKGIMISVTSLFLFSSIFLYCILKIKSSIGKWITVIGWGALNIAFSTINLSKYAIVISTIPSYVYGIVCIICIYSYLKNLEKLIFYKNINFQL